METPQFTWMGRPESELSRDDLIKIIKWQQEQVETTRRNHSEDVERWMNVAFSVSKKGSAER